jgi:hypothetical protein
MRQVDAMFRAARCALALSAVVAFAGCGGGEHQVADGGPDGDVVTCQDDPRVDHYVANLTKKSATGAYQIVLNAADPAPPAIGVNTWTIKVQDGAGGAMPAAALKVLPFMPDHGHGTSVKAAITSQPDGSMSVTPLYLFMGGVWRVEFNPATGAADPVDFFFCIAG